MVSDPAAGIVDDARVRARRRFSVLRSSSSRRVVDVELLEHTCADLNGYSGLLQKAIVDAAPTTASLGNVVHATDTLTTDLFAGHSTSDKPRAIRELSPDEVVRYAETARSEAIALLVVVPWSPPCREAATLLSEMLPDFTGRMTAAITTVTVDTSHPRVFDVRQFPTLLVIRSGQVRARIVGNLSAGELRSRLIDALSD